MRCSQAIPRTPMDSFWSQTISEQLSPMQKPRYPQTDLVEEVVNSSRLTSQPTHGR